MKELFAQNPVYATLAIVGTSLYIIKMLLLLFTGDGDGDFEADLEADAGGDSFSLISIQSILAFFMGVGWIGLAAKREWMLDNTLAILSSTAFGLLMMLFSSYITFKIRRFNQIPQTNMQEAVGKLGRAYTHIPEKGKGMGQVEIVVGGKQQILQASSDNEEIKSFESVEVVSVDDSQNLVVTKA